MKMKHVVLGAALIASTFGAAASARAPGLMYYRTFYSDATLTTQVGWYVDGCSSGNVVSTPVHGTTSPYYTLEAVGDCPGGYW